MLNSLFNITSLNDCEVFEKANDEGKLDSNH